LESNTCVLKAVSALYSEVVPALNPDRHQFINSRKLPLPARFILPGAVFHWDG